MPDKVGVAVSTMIGHGGSLAAAIIDHFLGEKSNVGPVKINAALAAVMSFASAWTDSANVGEGLAAFSRGFGLPMTYIGMREWLAKRWPTDAPVKEKTA